MNETAPIPDIPEKPRRFPWLASALFIFLLACPYALGYLRQSPDWVFTGVVRLAEDNNSYLAWAKQAQQGYFLFQNLYTTEPQPRIIFLPFFLAVGFFSRLTGLPVAAAMNLAQAASALFFLWALWRFLAEWVDDGRARGWAFALALFSSGWGAWLSLAARSFPDIQRWPFLRTGSPGIAGSADLWSFDFITFPNLLYYPLSGLSLGLLLLGLAFVRRGSAAASAPDFVKAGLCGALLALVHPYDGILFGALSALWALFAADRRVWARLPLLWAPLALAAGYLLWANRASPVLDLYGRQLRSLSAPFPSYIIGLAPLLPFALYAAVLGIFRRERAGIFLFLWAALGLAATQLPLGFAHKLVHGAHLAFALLAALGFVAWIRRRRLAVSLLAGVFLLSGLPTNLKMWREDMASAGIHWLPFYLPAPFHQALESLDENAAPADIVLVPRKLGLFVPPHTGCRVYAGHWDQTLDAVRKENEIGAFLSPAAGDAERRAFLADRGIRFLFLSPPFLGAQAARWDDLPGLRKLFDNGYYRIYRVGGAP